MEGVSMELQPLSCTYMSGIFLITNTYSKAKTFWRKKPLSHICLMQKQVELQVPRASLYLHVPVAIRRGSSTVCICIYTINGHCSSEWKLLAGLPIWWCVIVSSAALLCKVISEKFLRHVKLHVFMAQEVTVAPKSHTRLNACSAGESGARI